MSVWFVLASYPSIHIQPSVLISVAIGHSVSLMRMCVIYALFLPVVRSILPYNLITILQYNSF